MLYSTNSNESNDSSDNQTLKDYNYYTDNLQKSDKIAHSFGWGPSFHFFNSYFDDTFGQALIRHEHYLGNKLNLNQNDKVLDVGCGIGGPLREMIKMFKCDVTGVNNNAYQIQKAIKLCTQIDVMHKCNFVKGDFINLRELKDNSFDKIYSIEATCHATDLTLVYKELYRVLKPGGLVGIYEWCMTNNHNPKNKHHEELKLGIEKGDGIADLKNIEYAKNAFIKAGFELIEDQDLVDGFKGVQWYEPLEGRVKDGITGILRKKSLRKITQYLAYANELIGLAPKGTSKMALNLQIAQDCLIEAGKLGTFTPMYFLLGRKNQ